MSRTLKTIVPPGAAGRALVLALLLLAAGCQRACPVAFVPLGPGAEADLEAALLSAPLLPYPDGEPVVLALFATPDGDEVFTPRSIRYLPGVALTRRLPRAPLQPARTLERAGLYVAVYRGEIFSVDQIGSGAPSVAFYHVSPVADTRFVRIEGPEPDGGMAAELREDAPAALMLRLPYPGDAGVTVYEVKETAAGPSLSEVHSAIPSSIPADDRPPLRDFTPLRLRRP
jgi:hypothetical protein